MRTTQEFLYRIDEWCEKQTPKVSRAHALHVAMDQFLKAEAAKEAAAEGTRHSIEVLKARGDWPPKKGRRK